MPSTEKPTSAASLLGTVAILVQDTQVDVTRLIYMLYQDMEQQINRADFKAQMTLSTSAILIGMFVNLGAGVRAQGLASIHVFESAAICLYAAFTVFMGIALGRGIAAAFPRAVKKATGLNHSPSLYFSGQITLLSGEEYAEKFCQQSNDGVKRSVLGQIHSKSLVLEAKLDSVRKAMKSLMIAICIWIVARFVLIIGYSL